jgi:hypothetical protein
MKTLKSFTHHSWPASLLFLVACSSTGGGANPNGGPGGGGRQIATIPALTSTFVVQMAADGEGVVMSLFSDALVAVTPSGAVTTLYTPATGEYVGMLAPDGDRVYFNALEVAQETSTLFSVSRSGGPATVVTTSDATSMVSGALAVSASSIYLTYNASGTSTVPATIVQIDKSSGQRSVIYSAPSGQEIDFLLLDGASLYWSESDSSGDQGATVIRSAALGGPTLNATVVATIASPSDVLGLVETNGTLVGASLVGLSGGDAGISVPLPVDGAALRLAGGVFGIPQGATAAISVADYGTAPLAVNPGVVYYNYGTGIAKSQVNGGSIGQPVAVSQGFAPEMAGDGHGGLYYTQLGQGGLFKL